MYLMLIPFEQFYFMLFFKKCRCVLKSGSIRT
ncbi:hypothetical protein Godav_029168 [Gossypium davidsonii]|uniref:Uncharacterized protein n=1 Tax=Gossypium davidsonii TaxID=34287 RepID=A0A7J8THS0_GOSDV|nr:hypothetical protein [Gossypium davidsonii]